LSNIHGHRGFRGKYPENSIKGFIEAKKVRVDAIELDVVVSKDFQLIVNHDPWLKPGHFMINKTGEVPEEKVNLFEKTVEDIHQYALGTKRNLDFPQQIPFPHQIPTLEEVVNHSELQNTFWNIEIKSEEKWYDTYQPQAQVLAQLVFDFIRKEGLEKSCLVQSFDTTFLNELKKLKPSYPLGFLVKNKKSFQENIKNLDFTPEYFNPNKVMVDEKMISEIHAANVKCLIWTVNDLKRAKQLIDWGVDGIITDYPDEIDIWTIR
jgi:glycerophosphoryl diester phosphodiesterase